MAQYTKKKSGRSRRGRSFKKGRRKSSNKTLKTYRMARGGIRL